MATNAVFFSFVATLDEELSLLVGELHPGPDAVALTTDQLKGFIARLSVRDLASEAPTTISQPSSVCLNTLA
jgi:hypothetical protein